MIYTLVGDGTSDRVLIPIISWSLKRHGCPPESAQWADFTRTPTRPAYLSDRLRMALDLYPCDVLFVHRDAERHDPELRRIEIRDALEDVHVRHVPVVPVRVTEAWLLGSEDAIKAAAGNPNGKERLRLPRISRLEDVAEPKRQLHRALETAAGKGANRSGFSPHERIHRIPDYLDDFSFLDLVPSFAALQKDIQAVLTSLSGT